MCYTNCSKAYYRFAHLGGSTLSSNSRRALLEHVYTCTLSVYVFCNHSTKSQTRGMAGRQYITHPDRAGNAVEGLDGGEADFHGTAPQGSTGAQGRSQRSRCQPRVPDGFQHQLQLWMQSKVEQKALQVLAAVH